MILEELILHDFGVYRGRQVFDLSMRSPDRPIILIGAQNGAGKTTFLEGLQLALYGRMSQAGFRGATGYDAYLRSAINRAASPADGSQVQVSFRRTVEGQEQHYRVIRSWAVHKGSLRETFEVLVNGQSDAVLTSQWAEFVEEMLPPRIAPLFFFDGEKIEQFADLKRSSEIIGVAIKALLGLDIVEKLQLDLDVLERRKLAQQTSGDVKAELAAAEAEVEQAGLRSADAFAAVSAARTRRDRTADLLDRAQSALKSQGGDLFSSRESLLDQTTRNALEVEGAKRDLRSWAGGIAPLLMVKDLVLTVHRQARRETETDAAAGIFAYLEDRDQRLLDVLAEVPHPGLLTRVEAFLESDRRRLSDQAESARYLDLSLHARAGLDVLVNAGLGEAIEERRTIVRRLEDLEFEQEGLERRVAAIPASDSIAPLIAAVTLREAELQAAEGEFTALLEASQAAERDLAAAKSRYQNRLDQHVRDSLSIEDSDRIVRHSARARQTLASFKREVISHHVHRLEALILQGLNELLRKTDLIVSVNIDLDTFEIQLRDSAWDLLSPDQLSAGERQLLAVSLLWALAKASGQAAPTVIDTPLGRLDTRHRDRLVHRYFPLAADQVILLSTDEEIDERLYRELEPHLSRSFTIAHDAQLGGSHVVPGYAFSAKATQEAA